MNNEIWRTVSMLPPSIEVSSEGRIRKYVTLTEHTIVNPSKSGGYEVINHGGKSYPVHRLIAEAFVPNPNGHNIINHINGVKTDNRAVNLEWVSYKDNCTKSYGYGTEGRKKIYVKELDRVFGSLRTAAYYTGVPQDIIAEAMKNNETILGLSFVYINRDNPLLADHNVYYIDFARMMDIVRNCEDVNQLREALLDELGEGIKAPYSELWKKDS